MSLKLASPVWGDARNQRLFIALFIFCFSFVVFDVKPEATFETPKHAQQIFKGDSQILAMQSRILFVPKTTINTITM